MKTLRPYQAEALQNLQAAIRQTAEPILVTASVGAGKSLIIAEALKWLESHGKRSLCLTMNSSLIEQNAKTYQEQGGHCGIYCTGLGRKDTKSPVIFASPHSIVRGIHNKNTIAAIDFDCVIVDESHNIHPHNPKSMYQRIFRHYANRCQQRQSNFRVIGLTGTPYRGKNESIVGENAFFKEEVCNISASWLIQNGYLSPPVFGLTHQQIDFSRVRLMQTGKFNQKDLETTVEKNQRLTHAILQEVAQVVQERAGAFVFASSAKHCMECLEALGAQQAAVITADTPHAERTRLLNAAREGELKYLINVNVLTVGVDVPNFDTVVFLRPTESLVLYTQAIGRGLRLSPNKENCLILDYAGNLERFGDMDEAIINDALQPKEANAHEYVIPCQSCGTKNTEHARRCIGIQKNKRCDYYFEWKDCPQCGVQNDIVTRYCRGCEGELIDPNTKLRSNASRPDADLFDVHTMEWGFISQNRLFVIYKNATAQVSETFYFSSEKACRYTYGVFFKKHYEKASEFYPLLADTRKLMAAMHQQYPMCPYQIEVSNGKVVKKYF